MTESYERDFQDHDDADQMLIDAAVREIRRVIASWTSGPLPVQEFDPGLDVHPVDPGIWAASWKPGNARMTFSLSDTDDEGHPEKLVLRRVGGHAIYADS